MKSRIISCLVLTAGLCIGESATAQQIILEKAVVSAGASQASNGTTVGQVTLAQPVAGRATNGQTVGQFGFWNSATAAVQRVPATIAGDFDLRLQPNPASDRVDITVRLD